MFIFANFEMVEPDHRLHPNRWGVGYRFRLENMKAVAECLDSVDADTVKCHLCDLTGLSLILDTARSDFYSGCPS